MELIKNIWHFVDDIYPNVQTVKIRYILSHMIVSEMRAHDL